MMNHPMTRRQNPEDLTEVLARVRSGDRDAFDLLKAKLDPIISEELEALNDAALQEAPNPNLVERLKAEIWRLVAYRAESSSTLSEEDVRSLARESAEVAKLIIDYQAGSQAAFTELWNRYKGFVRGTLSRLLPGREIEDAMQEVFLKLAQNLDPGRAVTVRAFLRRLAVTTAYDFIRKGEKEPISESDLTRDGKGRSVLERMSGTIEPIDLSSVQEEAAERAEQFKELLYALFDGSSPPHQALVFLLCKGLEIAPREIVAQYSQTPLGELAHETLLKVSGGVLPKAEVEKIFEPLFEDLERPACEVLRDEKSVETYRDHYCEATGRPLLKSRCGDTRLVDYQTSDLAANITAWWDSVVRRLRKSLVTRRTQGSSKKK